MQSNHYSLIPAQAEVHRTAHAQNLIEVPKRAKLDREAEAKQSPKVLPLIENL